MIFAFCNFVRFALVWFCLFPLPLGVWDVLQLVIVALPGLSWIHYWPFHCVSFIVVLFVNCYLVFLILMFFF